VGKAGAHIQRKKPLKRGQAGKKPKARRFDVVSSVRWKFGGVKSKTRGGKAKRKGEGREAKKAKCRNIIHHGFVLSIINLSKSSKPRKRKP